MRTISCVAAPCCSTALAIRVATDDGENRDLDAEFVEMDRTIPEAFQSYRARATTPRERALW
ncbi:hypothetical protein OMR07_24880, partial [Methylobacterium organophilum]|nr:hypothetical protein [Methylobacterium organophilum]